MGTEIGRLGCYGFRAGDGSNQEKGQMGAGYVNQQRGKK